MVPFLSLVVTWMSAIVSELVQRPLLMNPAAQLRFPLGFLLLALVRISLDFHRHLIRRVSRDPWTTTSSPRMDWWRPAP